MTEPIGGAPEAGYSKPSSRWSPSTKQAATRLILLGCAYLLGAVLAVAMFTVRSSSLIVTVHSTSGGSSVRSSSVIQGQTLYQVNPHPVTAILIAMAVALVTATVSLSWRVRHRSTRVGIAGMMVGGLVGVVAMLGVLTVGPFILPMAVLLIVIALPMDKIAA